MRRGRYAEQMQAAREAGRVQQMRLAYLGARSRLTPALKARIEEQYHGAVAAGCFISATTHHSGRPEHWPLAWPLRSGDAGADGSRRALKGAPARAIREGRQRIEDVARCFPRGWPRYRSFLAG